MLKEICSFERRNIDLGKFYEVSGGGASICLASNIDRDSGVDINLDFLIPKCLINAIFFDSTNNSLLKSS